MFEKGKLLEFVVFFMVLRRKFLAFLEGALSFEFFLFVKFIFKQEQKYLQDFWKDRWIWSLFLKKTNLIKKASLKSLVQVEQITDPIFFSRH